MRSEDLDHQKTGPDADTTIGYVEVGPVVVDDVDLEKVDDVVVADAVVKIAEGSSKDEGERYGGHGQRAAHPPQHNGEDKHGKDGERDEDVADRDRRCTLREHAEGRPGVVDVGDAKDSGDDGMSLPVGQLRGDDALGDAIEHDDGGGDGEHETELIFLRRGFCAECGGCVG